MSYLLLLPHIRIENANAVSGLTWGFPSMTHFSVMFMRFLEKSWMNLA